MKNCMKEELVKSIMSVVAALIFSMTAVAAEVTVIDGQTWCYVVRNGTATIGAPSENKLAVPRNSKGHLVIPSRLGASPVAQISQSAFYGCSNITEITIPKSVTDIGRSAFAYCGGLRAIVVDPENKKYAACDGILLDKAMKNLIFCPSAVKRVVIPKGVTAIGDNAFEGCQLTALSVSDSVETIGEWAFHNCRQLESVILPRQLKKISDWMFAGCSALKSIEIPEGVVEIGESAFWECSGLLSASIPAGVRNIGKDAFYGCSSMKAFEVREGNERYSSRSGLLCSVGGRKLICCPGGCRDLVIPDCVRQIGYRAFWDCTKLTNLTFASSVRGIGDEAFHNCKGLASVELSSNVEYIGGNAFWDCSSLGSIYLPSGLKSVENSAFSGCGALREIRVDHGCEIRMKDMLKDCWSIRSSVKIVETGRREFFGGVAELVRRLSDCLAVGHEELDPLRSHSLREKIEINRKGADLAFFWLIGSVICAFISLLAVLIMLRIHARSRKRLAGADEVNQVVAPSDSVGIAGCYMDCVRKYAVFSGRASRREFWTFTLANLALSVLWYLLGLPLVLFAQQAVLLIPGLAVTSRRLHDVGWSGWIQMLAVIPSWTALIAWSIGGVRWEILGFNLFYLPAVGLVSLGLTVVFLGWMLILLLKKGVR